MDQRTNIIITVAALLGSGALALLVDSRVIFYILLGCGVLVAFGAPRIGGAAQYAAFAWIVWAWIAAVFGVRSLQIAPLWVSALAGGIVCFGAALLWERAFAERRTATLIHLTLAIEALLVLFFATTSFFILGALHAVWFVGIGMLLHDATRGASRTRVQSVLMLCSVFMTALIAAGAWYL